MAPKRHADGTVEISKWTWRGILAVLVAVGGVLVQQNRDMAQTQDSHGESIARIEANVSHVRKDVDRLNDKFDRLGAGNLALLP